MFERGEMPGHIYLRIGDYEMAAIVNELAASAGKLMGVMPEMVDYFVPNLRIEDY